MEVTDVGHTPAPGLHRTQGLHQHRAVIVGSRGRRENSNGHCEEEQKLNGCVNKGALEGFSHRRGLLSTGDENTQLHFLSLPLPLVP